MSTYITRKISTSLTVKDNQVSFELLPVNTLRKQLYQVYCTHNIIPVRFHMQGDGQSFIITDRNACPADYLVLETQLSKSS